MSKQFDAKQYEKRVIEISGPPPSVEIPLVKVVDENGKEIRRGYYFRWICRQMCAAGDSLKPEDIKECVVYSGFADWNMPRNPEIMVVEPPYHIELIDPTQYYTA